MVAKGYRKTTQLPQTIPVFPLDMAILLPRGALPLQIFEPRYLNMVDDAMAGSRLIGMVQKALGGDRARPALARVGCAGRITAYAETGDGKYLITLTGVCRFRSEAELDALTPYRQVRADYGPFESDLHGADAVLEFDRPPFLALLRRYLDRRGLGIEWEMVNVAPGAALIDSLCMALPFAPAEKQALLEARALEERRAVLEALLEMDAASGVDDGDDAPPVLQ